MNEAESLTFTVAADVLDSKNADATYTWFKDKKALKDGGTVSRAKTTASPSQEPLVATAVHTGAKSRTESAQPRAPVASSRYC